MYQKDLHSPSHTFNDIPISDMTAGSIFRHVLLSAYYRSHPSDHEAPLYTFSCILALRLNNLVAICYLEFERPGGQIVLIGWKGTGRTWSWCFHRSQCNTPYRSP